jgi:coenzyme F420-reducing hydrogenase delta subunit
MRIKYPANVKIVQVPCTGRVSLVNILHAIECGADGVFLSGCLIGDCHYISGNEKAAASFNMPKGYLLRWG